MLPHKHKWSFIKEIKRKSVISGKEIIEETRNIFECDLCEEIISAPLGKIPKTRKSHLLVRLLKVFFSIKRR